jgi:hypothetical protein
MAFKARKHIATSCAIDITRRLFEHWPRARLGFAGKKTPL